MGGEDVPDLILMGIQAVVDVQNLSAGIAEYGVAALLDQGLYQNICAGKKHTLHPFLKFSVINRPHAAQPTCFIPSPMISAVR